jgi:indole-3-glycerol phosphate synthase
VSNALTPIVERTRAEVESRRAAVPIEELERLALERRATDPPRGFTEALRRPGLSVIAEHKRSSPSAGLIRDDLVLEDVVAAYERGGAAAVSVLTETASFGGSLQDLGRARAAASLPILRKDFIVDPYQVVEAMAAGADAILLIVAALTPEALADLYERAVGLGLGVLVEVHDRNELAAAAELGAEVIGINNRDLTTLQVDTGRTFELLEWMPAGTVSVSESGWRTREELRRLEDAGVDAVLVGEALMRSADIESACRALAS